MGIDVSTASSGSGTSNRRLRAGGRLGVLTVAFLLCLIVALRTGVSFAQAPDASTAQTETLRDHPSSAAPATAARPAEGTAALPLDAKIETLRQLLADPQIRALVEPGSPAQASAPAPVVAPSPETAVSGPETMTKSPLSETLERLRAHVRHLAQSAPVLRLDADRASSLVMGDMAQWGLSEVVVIVLGFLACGFAFDAIAHRFTRGLRRWMLLFPPTTARGRIIGLGGRIAYGFIMLAAFGAGSIGFFLLFEWPPFLREVVVAYLTAALITRGIQFLMRSLLLPPLLGVEAALAYRVLPMTDARAGHWYRWVTLTAALFSLAAATFGLLASVGFSHLSLQVIALPIDLTLVAVMTVAIWTRPAGETPNSSVASWLITLFLVSLWLCRLTGATTLFWTVAAVVLVPAIIVASHRAVLYMTRDDGPDHDMPVTPVVVAVADRALRMLLIGSAALFLLHIFQIDMGMMNGDGSLLMFLVRGALKALVVILGADFIWSVIKALIARKLGVSSRTLEGMTTDEDPEGGTSLTSEEARLLTLLPIIQNILFAAIGIVTVLMVLSALGVDIAPLIAGAGVLGVAIGFGAQTIVKDVISGIFYLFDDAFRIGEYIVSGSYKGTVESFSLRSIRLRHHRGPIYTVPFGELGAVQNMSRDWVIEKFSIKVGYDTDVDLARRLVKKIGIELAAHPEYKQHIIEPLKMQGIEAFGDYGIELRIKMKTRPGQQFTIRRKAYVAIRKAFEDNGITIPLPTVTVQDGSLGSAGAKYLTDTIAADVQANAPKTP